MTRQSCPTLEHGWSTSHVDFLILISRSSEQVGRLVARLAETKTAAEVAADAVGPGDKVQSELEQLRSQTVVYFSERVCHQAACSNAGLFDHSAAQGSQCSKAAGVKRGDGGGGTSWTSERTLYEIGRQKVEHWILRHMYVGQIHER